MMQAAPRQNPRRALVREADLRRWARISRDEGVSIRGQIGPDGQITIQIAPALPIQAGRNDSDLDARLDAFAAL